MKKLNTKSCVQVGHKMKTVSIINLKGGVGKTITAVNLAHMLAAVENKKVLLIDNDKQGNTTKFFHMHDSERASVAEVLLERDFDIKIAIQRTAYDNLDIISADMRLLESNKQLMLDMTRPQQSILKCALSAVADVYDYCIIDNAPDINLSIINALVASDYVILPLKLDKFALDGTDQLLATFSDVRNFNPDFKFLGCLVTVYANNKASNESLEWLRENSEYPVFSTPIRRTVKIDESTYWGKPILVHSPNCTAAKDYLEFMKELVAMTK